MKKLKFVMIAAIAAWSLQSCSGTKDSKATADSVNDKKVDASKDSAKAATATSVTTVDKDDAKFATAAASGGMSEVMLGKIAQAKGTSARVKAFGGMMVMDHTKANNEMMALAKAKNITLPAVPSADDQKGIDDLNKKMGVDFDKAYASAMVDDHKKDISLFEDAAKNAKDPDLKAFATKTLPVLRMHLDSAKAVNDALKKK